MSDGFKKKISEFGVERVIGLSLLLLILGLAEFGDLERLAFKTGDDLKFQELMLTLLLLSIFLERTIEVFLSAWRSRDADKLDNNIKCLEDFIEKSDKDKIPPESLCTDDTKNSSKSAFDQLMLTNRARVKYSSQSRLVAIWGGLILGVLISAAGVRILENIFVNIGSNNQPHVIAWLDIFITGCVLSGGSEFFNKLMKVYSSAMDTSTKKIKKANK